MLKRAGWAAGLLMIASAAEARQAEVAPYTRVIDEDGGGAIRMEMAVREFHSEKPGQPTVYLAGAVHVADKKFYEELQAFLDAQDVVLFEGVKPAGAGDGEHGLPTDDAGRAELTKSRIRLLATAVELYHEKHAAFPETLKQMVEGSDGRLSRLLGGATTDGWSHEIMFQVTDAGKENKPTDQDRGYEVESPGADGKVGGEGAAADIKYSEMKPVSKPEKGDRSEGIQSKLAKATGLVFQLDAMNNNKPNWRNSDLSIDQVQMRLEKAGADGSMLFKMLDGSSIFGKLAGVMLGLVSSSQEGKAMLRVMLVEMLGHADALMDQAPGGMGKLMGVILEDRNDVVVADLKKVIQTEPNVKTIAVIYGAGHLPGIQTRLLAMGYSPSGDTWRTAMRVEAKEAGISEQQMKQTRQMIQKMVEGQAKKKGK